MCTEAKGGSGIPPSARRDALSFFHPAIEKWFRTELGTPSEPQERAWPEIARSHHGSISKEARHRIEELLKRGELPCLVATSSLELGIDIGAVDLVVQIESPSTIAQVVQRIGRAGHRLDAVSKGVIMTKTRGDLLKCAFANAQVSSGYIEYGSSLYPSEGIDMQTMIDALEHLTTAFTRGKIWIGRSGMTVRSIGSCPIDEADPLLVERMSQMGYQSDYDGLTVWRTH